MLLTRLTGVACAVILAAPGWAYAGDVAGAAGILQDAAPPPRILLDQPPRAVEYQLNRLSADQLVRVERRDDDPRYRPVYIALLTRPGLSTVYRDEALAALTKMGSTNAGQVLLDALARVGSDDAATAAQLIRLLTAQATTDLRQQRPLFISAIEQPSDSAHVLRGAYAGLLVADGDSTAAWAAAARTEGHLRELLQSVPHLPPGASGDAVRSQLVSPISTLLAGGTAAAAARPAALTALTAVRPDAATFAVLAREVREGTDAPARMAAVRALPLIPEAAWPADALEPLARAVVDRVTAMSAADRTEPDAIDLIQLGESLVARLPDATGRLLRRDLRALGVQVVRIATLPEQLSYDLRWFAVEAGKPVQIVFVNPDAMPHNVVIGTPGSLEELGTTGSAMAMPADPQVKPFVPNSPKVLFATRLLTQGQTERLGFVAPTEPGAYIYVCTFPGHWVRMYGVMLVVTSLEAWEAAPTAPIDPMTKQPFPSQRNQ